MLYTPFFKKIFVLFLCLFTISGAFASNDVVSGLTRPVFNTEHLLAIIAVGILGGRGAGKASVNVSLVFVVCMLIGGILEMKNITSLPVNIGVTVSLVVLGIAIALQKKLQLALILIISSVFAIFHGYGFGAEMPRAAQPMMYTIGVLISSTGLLVAGSLIASIAKSIPGGDFLLRVGGVIIAAVGIYILFGL